ncbi:MAG TPA: hypothetical protein VML35_02785 [Gaiellaceae bacterium]|nr:hypothetical protein [Gaiellaceae bacterium]
MDPEIFMWLALESFAVLAIVLVGWTIVHLAAPRGDDDRHGPDVAGGG